MQVAIVHDDLVQWGGAERVLLAISEVFPQAPIYTAVFNRKNKILVEKLKGKKIITSFMQNIPGVVSLYKTLLPLYPIAFEQFDFSGYDLVISHTTRFAKSVITKPGTHHICYCHTPPRFLWNFSDENVANILKPYLSFLRIYDDVSAKRVDYFLSGSKNSKDRIKKVYKKDSKILYPFVDSTFFNTETFSGGYFLIIGRLNKYKRVDLAIEVFNELNQNLKVVGVGPELSNLKAKANRNIQFLESLSENTLLSIIAGCKALLVTGEEDFGLTALEAQAMGKPVIAFKKGGSLETVIENETGIFFNHQNIDSLKDALGRFKSFKFNKNSCKMNAKNFSKEIFKENLAKFVSEVV